MSNDYASIAKYFAELGMARRASRRGPYLAGVPEPENVAEHVYRAAHIGYVLAKLEKVDADKVVRMVLFHDDAEIRVGDQNKVSARYFSISQAESAASNEQLKQLPAEIGNDLQTDYSEFEARQSKEAIVAKDADWLEAAISAKEHIEQGYQGMQNWIENVRGALKTDAAKAILAEVEGMDDFTNSWWQGLKKLDI